MTDRRGRILGVTIVGAHAGELIGTWALAMQNGLDIKAMAGSMLVRCIAKDDPVKYFAAVDLLFKQQNYWVTNDTKEALARIGMQAGLGQQEVEDCLASTVVLYQ